MVDFCRMVIQVQIPAQSPVRTEGRLRFFFSVGNRYSYKVGNLRYVFIAGSLENAKPAQQTHVHLTATHTCSLIPA